MSGIQTFQSLRCPHCGGPLPGNVDQEVIICEYCGVAQRRLDIEKYIEQLKADVFGWVRSIVPAASVNIATVDSVARAQIFEQSIRGEVGSRLGSISAQLLKIAASPLFVPPFARPYTSSTIAGAAYSKDMLTQAARFQGLASFAQSEDQNTFMNEAVASSESLGYLANVMGIYAEPAERSYRTVAKNFESAAKVLQTDKTRTGGATRMAGLAAMSEGTALLFEGDLVRAKDKMVEADKLLGTSMAEVVRQPSMVSWYPGIKAEKGLAGCMGNIVDAVQAYKSSGLNPTEGLGNLERYVKGFEAVRAGAGGTLFVGNRLDTETFKDVAMFFRDVSLAKSSNRAVSAIGTGGIWVGCWLADLSYSFETGALFMKKGQSVQERFLVSGVFGFTPQYINSQPQALVTDIFSVRSDSTFSDRFLGREKTLTTGIGYSAFSNIGSASIPSSSPVVPPYCTRLEAEKMANIYIERVRQRLQGKLRIGMPSVGQMVYVAGSVSSGWLSVPGLPSGMSLYVGEQDFLTSRAI